MVVAYLTRQRHRSSDAHRLKILIYLRPPAPTTASANAAAWLAFAFCPVECEGHPACFVGSSQGTSGTSVFQLLSNALSANMSLCGSFVKLAREAELKYFVHFARCSQADSEAKDHSLQTLLLKCQTVTSSNQVVLEDLRRLRSRKMWQLLMFCCSKLLRFRKCFCQH